MIGRRGTDRWTWQLAVGKRRSHRRRSTAATSAAADEAAVETADDDECHSASKGLTTSAATRLPLSSSSRRRDRLDVKVVSSPDRRPSSVVYPRLTAASCVIRRRWSGPRRPPDVLYCRGRLPPKTLPTWLSSLLRLMLIVARQEQNQSFH